MKKTVFTFTLCFLKLHSWGRSMEETFDKNHSHLKPDFTVNEKQEWFIENSYLLMKPTLENLDFGMLVKDRAPGSGSSGKLEIHTKKPDFHWNSGVRLIFGRYLPHHDHWDISISSVYVYGGATRTIHANIEHNLGLTPTYGVASNAVTEAQSKLRGRWDLNYFTWDLGLGREIGLKRTITIHPFISLRTLLTYQDYDLKSSLENTSHMHIKAENSYWALGPRLGTHFGFYMKHSFSLLGQIAGAIVYGPYENHIHETSSSRDPLSAKDHDTWSRGNLEASLGLGWETWFRNQSVRLYPQILLEGNLFWNMNRNFDPKAQFSYAHGALTVMGVSFNLQIDF
jgi:hypothetical protein